jgi:hypothetical protein
MPKAEVKGSGCPQVAQHIRPLVWHGGQQAIIYRHVGTSYVDVPDRSTINNSEAASHLHRVSSRLAGQMQRDQPIIQNDSANSPVEPVRKPVMRDRDIAAPQRYLGGKATGGTTELSPQINLSLRQ